MVESTAPGGNPPPPPPTLQQAQGAVGTLDSILGAGGSVTDANRDMFNAALATINRFNAAAPGNEALLRPTMDALDQTRRTNIARGIDEENRRSGGMSGFIGEFLQSDMGKMLAGLLSMLGINMEGLQRTLSGGNAPAQPTTFNPAGPPIAGSVTVIRREGETDVALNSSIERDGTIRVANVDNTPVAVGTEVMVTQGGTGAAPTRLIVGQDGMLLPPAQTPGGQGSSVTR